MSNIAFGPFVLNPESRRLIRDGAPVSVTGKVLDTLIVLVQNHGRLTTKEELLAALWPDTTVEEANLTQNISMLRKILGDSPKDHRYIATIAGRGYSFIAPIAQDVTTVAQPREPGTRQWMALAALIVALAAATGYLLFKGTEPTGAALDFRIVPFTASPGVETMPAFSPDGKQIAFVRTERDPQPWRGFWKDFIGPANLYIKLVEAGTEVRLTTGVASDSFPAWSPDGQYIAFFRRTSSGDLAYYLVPAVGGPERRIAGAANVSGGLAWFPDGKRLVVSEVSTTPAPLVVISTETGERHVLTSPAESMDLYPEFSPDGKWVAFVRGVEYSKADIYLMPSSGGPVRRLTSDGNWKTSIAWTPNGREIICSSGSLRRIPIKDGTSREISTGAHYIGKVAVAHRGALLAYVSIGALHSLRQIEFANSGGMKPVTFTEFAPSTRDQNGAQYSPDGRRVAFQSARSGNWEIWTADVDGQNLRRLTAPKSAGSPAWSPDG